MVAASRLHRSRDRRDRGETLIEGPHLLEEARSADADIRAVFFAVDDPGIGDAVADGLDVSVVDERALQRLAGTDTPRGPIAVVAVPEPSQAPGPDHVLVSWGVSDPGNVGTMIRTASAFGWGFAFSEGTADPWAPKVLRSGAGLQFSTWIRPVRSVWDLRADGYSPRATVVAGGMSPDSIPTGRTAVLIGEEAWGLPDDVVEACDGSITIAMPGGAESLNAAVAAGILVYALSKHSGEQPGDV